MNVTLDPKEEKDLELLARERGKRPEELLRDLVHEALSERAGNGCSGEEEALEAARQREALRKLNERFDALPLVKHADGLSGSRHHDAILYGKRPS